MSGRRRLDWLGLTPEPERELPAAVAALRASSQAAHRPPANREELAAAERRRVERLVLRGSRHSWLRYLAEVTALVTTVTARIDEAPDADRGEDQGEDPAASALLAAEVLLDHHRMLIGLPGAGYGRTAGDRTALEAAVRTLRTHPRTGRGSRRARATDPPRTPRTPPTGDAR
ncbi:hypothetical protein ACIGEZ_23600 [Streptomyces sp. NPDC085481]|uniref:hypothetical protein n=1 Tax=Streptomyces sp. NPDC085481 TaxID=3365727 RepID=UPI0037D939BF